MKGARTPKRLLAMIVCVIIALLCTVPALSAFGEDDILTVGVPVNRCPIFYQDASTGEVVGIGVDLMRAAAEGAGYTAVFEPIKEGLPREVIDSGAYDVAMPFTNNLDSASGRTLVVSDELIQMPFTLVTVKDRGLSLQANIKIGMQRTLGATANTVKELYPGIEITLYDSLDECVNALRAGEVDALLNNAYAWSYELQRPSYSDLKVQPSSLFSMGFRVGALDTPEGRATIERLNGGIAKLNDTRREAIVLDYTSRRLYRYDVFDYLHEYGLAMLLGVLLIASLVVIIVLSRRAARLEQEEKMRKLIDHDSLTGALSLTGFRKRVEEILRANPNVPYVLSYNNIKNFKFINDSYGMKSGDDLLRFWVERSKKTFADDEVIGRLEGDHFAVLRRVGGEERMRQDEEDVLNPLRNYFIDRGKETRVQICSGVYVLTPEDYQEIDVDHMLDCARIAEKRLSETRKDGFEFYNRNQWEKGKLSADIVSRLPLAIQSEEIQVWYQPQVDFGAETIIGAEALCRWNHGKLGWLSPAQFIPALEEAGLIFDLDCFVWEKVCRDLRRWNEQGTHRSISVNLSRRDIEESRNIPEHFRNLAETHGLAPGQLRIEVTETAFAENPDLLIETTQRLREFGFTVEMDDFGSGYSSLHMLKEVPVDRIKLDLHFLTSSGDLEKSRIIVSDMIGLVGRLGMEMIAEGVETKKQADFLREHGCSEMQGYYFFKPMPVESFEKLGTTIERA